jgi:hypothetical protein
MDATHPETPGRGRAGAVLAIAAGLPALPKTGEAAERSVAFFMDGRRVFRGLREILCQSVTIGCAHSGRYNNIAIVTG